MPSPLSVDCGSQLQALELALNLKVRCQAAWWMISLLSLANLAAAAGSLQLLEAVRNGDTEAVRILLQQDVDVTARSGDGATAPLLQVGRPKAQGQDSNDTGAFGSPTGITVDPTTNEVYVAERVRQPPYHRLRCRHGCLQAALGSLRQHA